MQHTKNVFLLTITNTIIMRQKSIFFFLIKIAFTLFVYLFELNREYSSENTVNKIITCKRWLLFNNSRNKHKKHSK